MSFNIEAETEFFYIHCRGNLLKNVYLIYEIGVKTETDERRGFVSMLDVPQYSLIHSF